MPVDRPLARGEPLLNLDYFAPGNPDPRIGTAAVASGAAVRRNGAPAEMPGLIVMETVSSTAPSVPQQFVDTCLCPRPFVDALDDHGADERGAGEPSRAGLPGMAPGTTTE